LNTELFESRECVMSLAIISERIYAEACDLCESPKYCDYVSKVGPKIAGRAATTVTGNPSIGLAVDVATTTACHYAAKPTAQVLTSMVLGGILAVASIVLAPVLVMVVIVCAVDEFLGS
jgi:hypothetical protein